MTHMLCVVLFFLYQICQDCLALRKQKVGQILQEIAAL